MMTLFDTHAHYDSRQFDCDRDAVLSVLPEQGVALVVNPGCDLLSSCKAVELAQRYPFVYAAVGVHPEDCADWEDGCLLTISPHETEEGEAWSLPVLRFDADKWASSLGAYSFYDCTAVWPEVGTWSDYQVGSEMIS